MNVPGRLTMRELMDDPARSLPELRATLRDLGRINRFFGTHAAVRAYMDRALLVWQARRNPAPLAVLDVATGGADIPRAVAQWGARRRVPVRVIAVDLHPATARLARDATSSSRVISVIQADARALPFPDGSFDVCLCTLTLHHLTPDEDLALLRRLDRLARVGFLVMDLLRSRSGHAGVWLLTRLSRSPLMRYDAPLSVRRAFSWEEYCAMAAASGIPGIRVARRPLFRVTLERIGQP